LSHQESVGFEGGGGGVITACIGRTTLRCFGNELIVYSRPDNWRPSN
jgi:hypothetical protein